MIVTLLMNALHAVLAPVASALPQTTAAGATSGLGGYLAAMNQVVAITGPLALIGVLLAATGPLLAFRIAVWAYRLLPGKFT